jgi:hypothetical protein
MFFSNGIIQLKLFLHTYVSFYLQVKLFRHTYVSIYLQIKLFHLPMYQFIYTGA